MGHAESTFDIILKQLSLRKNFVWTLAGNISLAASQWAVVVVIAKVGSPKEVGFYAYALAVTAPIILFSNLKLRSAQATDARGDYHFGHYLALRIVTTVAALVVIGAIAFLGEHDRSISWSLILIGSAKGVESLSDVYYGLFQQRERMDLISISLLLRSVLGVLSVTGALIITKNLLTSLSLLFAAWSIVLLFYDMRQAGILLNTSSAPVPAPALCSPLWERKQLMQLAMLTLPLGFSVALGSLYTNIPRYFLEHESGIYGLGIFSALAYIMIAGGTVINALGQSASPRLAKLFANGNYRQFITLTGKLVLIGTALGGAGILVAATVGKTLLATLYTSEYAAYSGTFLLVMIAAGIQYTYLFLGSAINAMRLFRTQMLITVFSTTILALFCYILIGRKGMDGAAYAMIFAKLFESVCYVFIIIRILKGKLARKGTGGVIDCQSSS